MEPRIELLPPTRIIGRQLRMSLLENKTPELWSSFMPRRKEISHAGSMISLQVYDAATDPFDPATVFTKWAGVIVPAFENIPEGLETYVVQGGQYAVFLHKGGPPAFPATIAFIFGTWMPGSGYQPDHREHFEILDHRYRHNDPASEEEIWIPIKEKS